MSGGGEYLKDEGSRGQVVIAGGVAGLVSRFCIAPLDVLKIRLQLQSHSLSDPLSTPQSYRRQPPSTTSTLKDILQHEGVTALWKGNIPAELLYVTYGACQFTAYTTFTTLLPPMAPSMTAFIAGAAAGATATTATYPLDLLRTRFAAQGSDKVYSSFLGSIRDIARSEGTRGFFQGLGAGVGQIVPYMGLFLLLTSPFGPSFRPSIYLLAVVTPQPES
ncbi:mitochondrial thiamine pyrophosphate transporter [Physcia stellaris]|nr:mitochondrial thiamine pyrophosphate transporter [Physcia stellaris]